MAKDEGELDKQRKFSIRDWFIILGFIATFGGGYITNKVSVGYEIAALKTEIASERAARQATDDNVKALTQRQDAADKSDVLIVYKLNLILRKLGIEE